MHERELREECFRGELVFHLAIAKQDPSYHCQVCIGHWHTFCLLLCFFGIFIALLAFPLFACSASIMWC